jgi:cell division protein FtsN
MNRHTPPRGQQGGTLLGFVLGLLVGLGVALAVAIYVTKAPVPLMDRGVQRPVTPEAIEAERLRNWNPNAHLSTQPAAPPAPAAPAAPAADESRPPAEDPIGQLIEQRANPAPTGATAGAAPPLVDPFIYFVQVGAFRNAPEAEAQRAKLAMLGFEVSVSEREQAGQPVFRVRIGPFDRRLDAELMEQRVLGNGFETALVRVQR